MKPGIQVITPEPEDLRRRALELPRRLGLRARQDGKATRPRRSDFVAAIFKNVPVLDTGARGSTTTFAQRGIGDVLLAWENEAFLACEEFGEDKFEIVVPSLSILAEPPVALVDGNVDAKGTRKAAEAYLEFLYTPDGAGDHRQALLPAVEARGARPRPISRGCRSSKLVTIDEDFGGWAKAQTDAFRRRRHLRPASTRPKPLTPMRRRAASSRRRRPALPAPSALPGFGSRSATRSIYLGLIVLIPLAALVLQAVGARARRALSAIADRRPRVAGGAAALASASRSRRRSIDAVFGLLVAWVLARYRFPGRRLLDAAVDLPFALPTAVAGIALAALYAPNGWIGALLAPLGIKVAFTPLGIFVALVFVGLPFVVRTVQPLIAEIDRELEEAAATLGASRAAHRRAR